jgi:hypothetical protein
MGQGGFGGQYETGVSSRGAAALRDFAGICRLRVQRRRFDLDRRLPVYPNKQILLVSVGTPQTANNEHSCSPGAVTPAVPLFAAPLRI